MCHHFLWWVRRFFLVPSFRIPLIWFLYFLLSTTFHRCLLPLVSLMSGTSVAWISSSIVYFWRDLDLHGMLCFLRKFFPLLLFVIIYIIVLFMELFNLVLVIIMEHFVFDIQDECQFCAVSSPSINGSQRAIFLLLWMFRSRYYVSLCRSVYCLCVNVYCTTAIGCQHDYS